MTGHRILFKVGNGTVWDSLTTYNIALETPPSAIILEPKNIATNDWYDEDGLDTYIPDVIKYKAQDCTFKFVCKVVNAANVQSPISAFTKVKSFIDALKVGTFQYYIEYQGQGRSGCVLKKSNDSAEFSRGLLSDGSEEQVIKFSCVFTINSPATNVILSI